jgi:hypothetical protein
LSWREKCRIQQVTEALQLKGWAGFPKATLDLPNDDYFIRRLLGPNTEIPVF